MNNLSSIRQQLDELGSPYEDPVFLTIPPVLSDSQLATDEQLKAWVASQKLAAKSAKSAKAAKSAKKAQQLQHPLLTERNPKVAHDPKRYQPKKTLIEHNTAEYAAITFVKKEYNVIEFRCNSDKLFIHKLRVNSKPREGFNKYHQDLGIYAVQYTDRYYWYQNDTSNTHRHLQACIKCYIDDKLVATYWYHNNALNRKDCKHLPSVIYYDDTGAEITKMWYTSGKLHRTGGLPAYVTNDVMRWYTHGNLNRKDDLPATTYSDGTNMWFNNDILHRTTKDKYGYPNPAVISPTEIAWYFEGRLIKKYDRNSEEVSTYTTPSNNFGDYDPRPTQQIHIIQSEQQDLQYIDQDVPSMQSEQQDLQYIDQDLPSIQSEQIVEQDDLYNELSSDQDDIYEAQEPTEQVESLYDIPTVNISDLVIYPAQDNEITNEFTIEIINDIEFIYEPPQVYCNNEESTEEFLSEPDQLLNPTINDIMNSFNLYDFSDIVVDSDLTDTDTSINDEYIDKLFDS